MAWCRPGYKPLSEAMMVNFLMHICVSRPQWVKVHFLEWNWWILLKISMKFVPKVPINNIPTLVQIMAWRGPGDKPLSELMMVRLPTHMWDKGNQCGWTECHVMMIMLHCWSDSQLEPAKLTAITFGNGFIMIGYMSKISLLTSRSVEGTVTGTGIFPCFISVKTS